MDNKPKTGARDFFLYLAGMATLYISVISLITLIFQYINFLFPDELRGYYDPFSSSIRFAIASLIIIFPLYLFFTRKIKKEERAHPEKRNLWVRKWLVYLTLFVGGITLTGDLIALINEFLGGELTTRFILKVITILIVIGAAFTYYLLDLRGHWERKEKESKIIGVIVSLIVLVAIISGFFIIGSPATQRKIRLDNERVADLRDIQWKVVNFWQQKGFLPANMEELEDPLSGFSVPTDPVTGEDYVYDRTAIRGFSLCANFDLGSVGKTESIQIVSDLETDRSIARPIPTKNESWTHEAGEVCFEREIDPQLYPVRK